MSVLYVYIVVEQIFKQGLEFSRGPETYVEYCSTKGSAKGRNRLIGTGCPEINLPERKLNISIIFLIKSNNFCF